MFEKPKVTFVQSQQVESEREITGYEAEEILRKYGYSERGTTRVEQSKKALTFEEMIAQQEAEKMAKIQKQNGHKPITFNGKDYDTEVKYGSDDDLGFGFRIEITTDMKLPKY
jgi:hypothetical protein